jgi:G3E family GTPase
MVSLRPILTSLLLRHGLVSAFTPAKSRFQRAFALQASSSPVPVTLISGFLGTGKTTALKHLLENKEQLEIGVIVNDLASVNIDSKLIAGSAKGDMVELQNGCACCSSADELFVSVERLLQGRNLDAVVVELSGVADPMAIKNNWKMAPPAIRKIADVAKVVTLVDANTFGSDFMTWDLAAERKDWVDPADECAGSRKVAELLAEQVEAADLILVNKVDMATEEETKVATSVAKAMNEKAEIIQVQFGKVSPRSMISLAMPSTSEASHDHDHAGVDCKDVDCTDTSHSHSHDHACAEPACTDTSHSHTHDHSASDCADPGCTDTSHSHSLDHSASDCADPGCTDTSHSHSHSHQTSMDNLGITSFVYKARTPFSAKRIMDLLSKWPVPIKETLDLGLIQDAQSEGYVVGGDQVSGDSPFLGVLRSKGFSWFAPGKWSGANDDAWRHETAMYWSHAGKHFSISSAGKWWATIPKREIKNLFVDNMDEYERILRDDFVSEEFGDRRQEIVFIGTGINQDKITKALDDCLLCDSELTTYRQRLQNHMSTIFTTGGRSGLFGSMDHLDK